jgi:hypothetical protein
VAKPASTAEVDGRIVDKVWMERGSIGPKARNSDEWMRDNAGAGWEHIRHNHINNKAAMINSQDLVKSMKTQVELRN